MKYKYALSALGLLVLQACTPEDRGSSQEAPGNVATGTTPPNILLIVADDLGFTDIGAFGSEISTPNLDRLAHGGLRLNNMHAASCCRPARLMLMSGAGAVAANQPIPESHRGGTLGLNYATIAELLQDAGYATYITGKWDLGDIEGYTPDARGFDRSFVQTGGSANYFPELFLGRAFGYREDGRELTPQDVAEDFYATRAYTDKMLEYLRSTDEGTPWFAYMPYTAPHWPLQLPEDWLDRYAWPHFTGRAPGVHAPTDSAGWVGIRAGGALIRGNRKIIDEPPPGGTESTPWRLYDLANDPGETRDLAAESPELVAELVREWEANWR